MTNLKDSYLALPRLYQYGILVGLVLLLIFTAAGLANAWSRNVYEKKQTQLQAQNLELEKQIVIEKSAAQDAAIKQAALETELATVNQRLLNANAELVKAREVSAQTRIKYVESQKTVTLPVYITGNPLPDSHELCARLAAEGPAFACNPKQPPEH